MSFTIDWYELPIALVIGAFCFLLWRWNARFLAPQILVSDLTPFTFGRAWRPGISRFSQSLRCLVLGVFLLALLNPRFYIERRDLLDPNQDNQATNGIALYLILDQSGSMSQTVTFQNANGLPERMPKVELLKKLTSEFILGDSKLGLNGRPNDLIGLVEFARTARLVSPLTLDHQMLIKKLSQFSVVKDKADDGTAIGYAIYKTANLIISTRNYARDLIGKGKPAYEIKSAVMLLVTDGLQDPNPIDIGSRWRWMAPFDAAQFAKENNIKLYIVNVEPKFNTSEFQANLSQMRKTAEMTGGKFFIVNDTSNLGEIYAEIDQLEKSALPIAQELLKDLRKRLSLDQLPTIYKRQSLYPYLIAFGLICLALWAILETVILRKLP